MEFLDIIWKNLRVFFVCLFVSTVLTVQYCTQYPYSIQYTIQYSTVQYCKIYKKRLPVISKSRGFVVDGARRVEEASDVASEGKRLTRGSERRKKCVREKERERERQEAETETER